MRDETDRVRIIRISISYQSSDETDRVRMIRIGISYQSKRFSRIDQFDGSKMLVTFCELKRELHLLTMNEAKRSEAKQRTFISVE